MVPPSLMSPSCAAATAAALAAAAAASTAEPDTVAIASAAAAPKLGSRCSTDRLEEVAVDAAAVLVVVDCIAADADAEAVPEAVSDVVVVL